MLTTGAIRTIGTSSCHFRPGPDLLVKKKTFAHPWNMSIGHFRDNFLSLILYLACVQILNDILAQGGHPMTKLCNEN